MVIKIVIFLLSFAAVSSYAKTEVKTKCIAHRGNNKHFLENSYSSIKSAASLRVDGIEIDVRHTKDGVPILVHDRNLKRTAKSRAGKRCPLNRYIGNLNFEKIRKNCLLKNDEDIPVLSDVMEKFKKSKFDWYIELKDSPSLYTLEIFQRFINLGNTLNLISFKSKPLRKSFNFIKRDTENRNIYLYKLYRLYIVKDKKYAASVMYNYHNFRKILSSKSLGENGFWTIDKPEIMIKLFNEKVKFITTNDPGTCLTERDNL
jgi:glycerophosphoryl diester phosphodiesterase